MDEHILFLNMFSAYEPEPGDLQLLRDAQIIGADVDAQKRRIDVTMFAPVYISGRALHRIREQIMAVYELQDMHLFVKHPAQQLTSMEPEELMALFVEENSMTRGYLAGASWSWEGQTLTVDLRANGKKVLEECLPGVRRALQSRFDTDVTICIRASQSLDGQALFDAMEKMRRDALEELPKVTPVTKQEQPAQTQQTIFGKPFKGKSIPMQELTLDMGFVIVEGKVFNVEHKELQKRNAWVINFDITDNTSSVRVSRFLENKEAKPILEGVQVVAVVKVQGKQLIDN